MESVKLELIEKMEEKKISIPEAAKAIGLSANLLQLYLVKDAYPVPKRILDKLAEAISN
jgi:predicted HTH domain antitoxin